MKAKHAVLVTLSFVTAAAMAVPTRNVLQSAPDSEIACAHCANSQNPASATHEESASTARRVARQPQLDTASKKKLMGLMALFVSARASQ